MSDEAELQRRIAELEYAVNWTKPTLGFGEEFEGGLMAGPAIAQGFVRLWRAGRAVVEASESKAPPDTLVELERKLLNGQYIAAQPLRIIGLPDCTVLTEVSRAGLTLHVQPSDPAPDARAALASLVDIIERTGGYMTPADQEAMRTARALLAGGCHDGRG